MTDNQEEHERRQAADPEHDRSSCWCCCFDCSEGANMAVIMNLAVSLLADLCGGAGIRTRDDGV